MRPIGPCIGLHFMDFQDLHAFANVARHESYARAAIELRIAQSALSRRVARLEHQLGTKLLERVGRGVRLTEAGRVLQERAEHLMRDLEAIEADVQGLAKEPTGLVRVAFPPATSEILAPLLVSSCRSRFPRISLHLREGYSNFIHDWITRNEVDIALLYNPEEGAGLDISPIFDSPLHLIVPPSAKDEILHREGPSIGVKALFDLPLILPSRPHSLRLLVERCAAERGLQPKIVNEVVGSRATNALVAAGLGYTIFSYAGVYAEVAAGSLCAIPVKKPGLSWRLSMVHRTSARTSYAVMEVKRLITEHIDILRDREHWLGERNT